MRIINTALLEPRNVLIIGVLAVISHIVATPLYKAVSQGKQS